MVQTWDESRSRGDAFRKFRTVLALDLATSTGFAIGKPGDDPLIGSHRLPKTGDDVGAFIAAFDSWLLDLIGSHSPSLVIFEAPIIFAGATPVSTARKLMNLAGHTEWRARCAGIECREASNSEVCKFFTGRGSYPGKDRLEKKRAKKQAVIDKCSALGWTVQNDDEADAAALFCWAEHLYFPGCREVSPLFAGAVA